MVLPPPLPDAATLALISAARDAHTEKLVYACVATLFIYDYLITLGDEIELIWSRKLSVTEGVYFAARYSAWLEATEEIIFWFGDLDSSGCKIFGGYHAFSIVVGMVMSQSLIIVRTWAIWNGTRLIKVVFALFCAVVLAIPYISVQWITNTTFHSTRTLAPWLHGCAIYSPYRLVYVGWIMFCCTDFVLLWLTVVKGCQQLQPNSARLTVALYRDAFSIFFVVLMLAIANLTVTLVAAEHYQVLLYGVERMLHTMLACRMMLNLRATAQRTGTVQEMVTTGHNMNFNHEEGDFYELRPRDSVLGNATDV